ncbi:choline dehydrogenase [Spiribacter sp. C176]|uniref:Choline dehydrogenase n=1 Tax=Spiribacter salilacus TaxID=2664894 RepID=A0A6N7QKY7_9GAMM|nr:choline dehydrogenase [Spiribacter salilacus]
METYDYIIVGGGTAGCILAERLSANKKHRVLVIEAGSPPRSPWIPIPAGFSKLLVNQRYNWRLTSTPEPTTANRAIPIPRGRGLGGSSLINGMIYVRGQEQDYDRWAEAGAQGWDWRNVEPYFKRFEHCAFGDSTRGQAGPMHIEEVAERCKISEAALAAAHAAGWPMNKDYNSGDQTGFGYYQVLQKNRRRWSAYDAYLRPALSRPNLTVKTDAQVQRLIFNGNHCAGVRYLKAGRPMNAAASSEVILCAGSIHNPQLLELSGIGQPEHIKTLGIEPIHALNGVGENYQDHYATRMNWQVRDAVTINERSRGVRLIKELMRYALQRRGILSLGTGLVYGFVSTPYAKYGPDIQYFIVDASYANAAERVLDKTPGMTIGVTQLQPESKGSIHAVDSQIGSSPAIRPNFLSAGDDANALAEGMQMARKLVAQSPLNSLLVEEMNPGMDVNDSESLIEWARETGQTIYHPIGTCRMGREDDDQAVVNSRLKVRGLSGLRIADASVMPSMVSGNTQGAVMMVAEKAADIIIADKAS